LTSFASTRESTPRSNVVSGAHPEVTIIETRPDGGTKSRQSVNGLKALPVLEGLISDEVLLESQRMDRRFALRGIGGETDNQATAPHLCRRKEHRTNGGKLRNEAKTKRD
jgi:hypothetical protein